MGGERVKTAKAFCAITGQEIIIETKPGKPIWKARCNTICPIGNKGDVVYYHPRAEKDRKQYTFGVIKCDS